MRKCSLSAVGILVVHSVLAADPLPLVGDGVADDTAAIQSRIDTGASCVFTFDFDKWNPIRLNMDGIHLDGDCHHGRITDLNGTCFDDLVAINSFRRNPAALSRTS